MPKADGICLEGMVLTCPMKRGMSRLTLPPKNGGNRHPAVVSTGAVKPHDLSSVSLYEGSPS